MADQHAPPHRDVSAVRIPMLISGIFNILVALWWGSTCFLFFLGIPLLVLGIFEFIQFSKLADPANHQKSIGSTRLIGIFEICTILVGNLGSLVCGIIVLVNLEKLDDRR
ncbi:MAG: hypothetical protein HND58_15950 [Planctomycetota bacterium]|nr:MAG: hypothetical protein HND58_15950 [Planctomycetota bacterium]